jgi:GntR family transcriptional regulator
MNIFIMIEQVTAICIIDIIQLEVWHLLYFSSLKLNNGGPVYLQLVLFVKRGIYCGALKDGEALPSRRELAALLGINPNTVQKAYKLMEDEGFVVTPRNAASVLRVTPALLKRIGDELGREFVREFVEQARKNGLGYKRVIELISQYWEDSV